MGLVFLSIQLTYVFWLEHLSNLILHLIINNILKTTYGTRCVQELSGDHFKSYMSSHYAVHLNLIYYWMSTVIERNKKATFIIDIPSVVGNKLVCFPSMHISVSILPPLIRTPVLLKWDSYQRPQFNYIFYLKMLSPNKVTFQGTS